MMEEFNEKTFLDRLKNGDTEAFDALFNAITPHLCGIIVRTYGIQWHDAEEVAADAMLKVRNGVKTFSPVQAKLTTWIVTIAKNTAIDFLRKRIREEKYLNEWLEECSAQTECSTTEEKVLPNLTRLKRALSKLSQPHQQILLMKQSMTYEQIAETEGTSVGTLRTRYSRAVVELRASYEGDMSNE
jgi:RNA polymerase sigma factor (sigma-70 family)